MGRKKCGMKEMIVPLLKCRQGDYWEKESSVLLLKMYGVQLLGWERRSSWLSRTKRSKGIMKKLGGVCLALRNVVNMTVSPIDWLWRMLSGDHWDDGGELMVLLKRWRYWTVILITIMKSSWKYQNQSRTSDFSWWNIVLEVLVNMHCFHWNQWSRRNLCLPNLRDDRTTLLVFILNQAYFILIYLCIVQMSVLT